VYIGHFRGFKDILVIIGFYGYFGQFGGLAVFGSILGFLVIFLGFDILVTSWEYKITMFGSLVTF
jgi:hypothetical protein